MLTSAQQATVDVRRAYALETARLFRTRIPYGALIWLASILFAYLLERRVHPGRGGAFVVLYALEALTWGVAVLLTRRATVSTGRAISVTVLTVLTLMAIVTVYTIVVSGEADLTFLPLVYLTVGAMALFPWGGREQAAVVAMSVLFYLTATAMGAHAETPPGIRAVGLAAVGSITVGLAIFLERYRWNVFRQNSELRRANEALAEANRAKLQLLASVSHELKTPLTAMIGYAQLMRDDAFGEQPAEAQEALDRILAGSSMLLNLINDYLDFSALEANRLHLQMDVVELASVCTEVVGLVAPLMKDRPVKLTCDVPAGLAVHADRNRLRQVLINLLQNAQKFTESGEISVRARAAGDMVTIEVADTGSGIPPSEQQAIYEPFERGSNSDHVPGVGIGLALSRQLTESMGGAMALASEPGRGSTFSVRLRWVPDAEIGTTTR